MAEQDEIGNDKLMGCGATVQPTIHNTCTHKTMPRTDAQGPKTSFRASAGPETVLIGLGWKTFRQHAEDVRPQGLAGILLHPPTHFDLVVRMKAGPSHAIHTYKINAKALRAWSSSAGR